MQNSTFLYSQTASVATSQYPSEWQQKKHNCWWMAEKRNVFLVTVHFDVAECLAKAWALNIWLCHLQRNSGSDCLLLKNWGLEPGCPLAVVFIVIVSPVFVKNRLEWPLSHPPILPKPSNSPACLFKHPWLHHQSETLLLRCIHHQAPHVVHPKEPLHADRTMATTNIVI